MKRRTGFVSNSSSSSYICDICGEEIIGRDIGLDDAEMWKCGNGHTICNSHLNESLEKLILKDLRKRYPDNDDLEIFFKSFKPKYGDRIILEQFYSYNDYNLKSFQEVLDYKTYYEENEGLQVLVEYFCDEVYFGKETSKHCPICQMQSYSTKEMIQYYLKKNNITYDKIFEMVKNEFKDYGLFKKYKDGK